MNSRAIPNDDIRTAVMLLKAGETVVFPTETVYGLGADASNPKAVRRIFEIKGRPADHPLIVHIGDTSQLQVWAADIPDAAWRLAGRFWPGPLTLVLPRRSDVPPEVTGGLDTVALRVPDHPVAAALLRTFGSGVVAPSANRFGRVSPTTAQHVRDELGSTAGMIIDGGPCRIGVESTIVSLMHGEAVLLRPGSVSAEAIEDALHQRLSLPSPGVRRVLAPGMSDRHYAPETPLEIHLVSALWRRALQLAWQGCKVAVLKLGDDGERFAGERISVWYMPTSAGEYGRRLYATLHHLDHAGFDRLLVEALPATQEWLAINDRVRRAAQGIGKEA